MRKGIVRLGQRRIKKSIEALEGADRLQSVHEVRKGIKQVRGLLRLVRLAIKPADYRRCLSKLRRAARSLSAVRDSRVKVRALETMMANYRQELSAPPFLQLKRALREQYRNQELAFVEQHVKEVIRLLKQASCFLDCARFRLSGWRALGPGIERSFRDGRRGFQRARRTEKPEDFHQWRKRVKGLYFQMHLLSPVWPEHINAVTTELDQLGDLLGDDHDLFMLAEVVHTHASKWADSEPLNTLSILIGRRQQDLRSRALTVGGHFYREAPAAFCKRLARYWKNWRRLGKRVTSAVA